MSEEPVPYNPTYIVAWTSLSIVISVVVFATFVFNGPVTHAGHWIWDLIRYLASPII
jgi:hypothetical protein